MLWLGASGKRRLVALMFRALLFLLAVVSTVVAAFVVTEGLWRSELLEARVQALSSPWDVALPLLLVVVLSLAILRVLWQVPRVGDRMRDWVQGPQAEAARMRQQVLSTDGLEPKDRLGLHKDLLQVETASRGMVLQSVATTVQSITVLVAVFGLAGTCTNLQLAQQGQITDRFTKAIEQLGSVRDAADGKKEANLELRLGGIYALERIASDSPRDRRVVVEVLVTYVRENALWRGEQAAPAEAPPPPRLRADIQTALSALRRQSTKEALDLSGADLSGADLTGVNLTGTNLIGADLRGADLSGAVGLTREQLASAMNGGRDARLPEGLR